MEVYVFFKRRISVPRTSPALRNLGWVTFRGAAIFVQRDIAFEPSTLVFDPNGRYVIALGKLQNTPVVLASIYAPTWDNDKFISKCFSNISNFTDHHIIIGGNFNLVHVTDLGRSSTKPSTLSKSASAQVSCGPTRHNRPLEDKVPLKQSLLVLFAC